MVLIAVLYMHIYIYIHICIYTYIHIWSYMHICISISISIYIYICILNYTHTYIYMLCLWRNHPLGKLMTWDDSNMQSHLVAWRASRTRLRRKTMAIHGCFPFGNGYESKPWYPSEPQITGKWMFIPKWSAKFIFRKAACRIQVWIQQLEKKLKSSSANPG